MVSVTSRRHRVTAARWAGPRSRDLEGLSDPTSAHGAPPRAISAFAPLSGTPRLAAMLHQIAHRLGDERRFLSVGKIIIMQTEKFLLLPSVVFCSAHRSDRACYTGT